MSNFIKTKDDKLAAELKAANFSYLEKDTEGFHVFVNDGKYAFEKSASKPIFTNVLSM